MTIPQKKQRVEFGDGHCQVIEKLQADDSGDIAWLHRRYPTDPDWVYVGDLVWLEEEQRWLHVR